jgi:HNH endonuclease
MASDFRRHTFSGWQLVEFVPDMILEDRAEKLCLECNRTKPAEDFSPSAKGSLGLASYCRDCIRWRAHVASYRCGVPMMPWMTVAQDHLIITLIRRDGRNCQLCGEALVFEPGEVHVDHRISPRWGGWKYDVRNLQLAHRGCNSSKGDGFAAMRLRV